MDPNICPESATMILSTALFMLRRKPMPASWAACNSLLLVLWKACMSTGLHAAGGVPMKTD